MKILAIRGRNIASLEGDFEVDFRREPLASAGLFAIVGPTGAGKSTLLDVLCLALYDTTPRTDKAKENNVAVADAGGKSLSQNDSRSLLRRGCGEGYAEVDFLALSGVSYRSRWSVRRSRERADGALQNVEMRLYNLQDGKEEGGTKKELLEQVSRLVGLSFEQFSRSVLLAQGDFATFLKAKQAEKAEILEKLTGTEVYGRISAELYRRCKEAQTRYRECDLQAEGVVLMQEEERRRLTAEQEALLPALQRLSAENEAQRKALQWWRRSDELQAALTQAEQDEATVRTRLEAFAAACPQWPRLACAWQIRAEYADYCRDVRERQVAEQESTRLQAVLTQTVGQLADAEKRRDGARTARQAWERQYDAEVAPRIEQAKRLRTAMQERQTFLNARQTAYHQAQTQWQRQADEMALLTQRLAAAAKELADEQAYADAHAAEAELAGQAPLLLKLCQTAVQEVDQQRQNARLAETNRQQLTAERADLEEKRQQAARWAEALPEQLLTWRRQLQEGQPCPVCGAVHHPWGDRTDVLSDDEARLRQKQATLQAEIETLTQDVERREKEMNRLETLAGTYGERAASVRRELAAPLARRLPDWESLLEAGTLQAELERRADAWRHHETRRQTAGQQERECRLALDGLRDAVEVAAQGLRQQEEELSTLRQQIAAITADYRALFGDEKLEQVETRYRQQRQDLEKALQAGEEALHTIENDKGRTESLQAQNRRQQTALAGAVEQKRRQIDDWLAARPELGGFEALQALLETPEADYRQWQQQSDTLRQARTEAQSVLAERRRQQAEHAASPDRPASGVDRPAVESQSELTRKALEAAQARKAELELLFRQDTERQARLKELAEKREKARLVYEDWAKLNELFGSADGGKFKQVAQGYTLDVLVGYANRHLRQLAARYEIQRIEDTLALQVADGDMLGELRSVHSLSGGESFLVSLALALGLSSLSSRAMRVDSLFIDEGFGSLDADTLQTAMAALDQLQTQGRKIGVITHVAEMTERIACRITVEPTGGGGSRLRLP